MKKKKQPGGGKRIKKTLKEGNVRLGERREGDKVKCTNHPDGWRRKKLTKNSVGKHGYWGKTICSPERTTWKQDLSKNTNSEN